MPSPETVLCLGCRHFRVMHDPDWPYACLRFALRSRRSPAVEVRATCGEECAAKEPLPRSRGALAPELRGTDGPRAGRLPRGAAAGREEPPGG